MARKSNFDAAKLRALVSEGKNAQQIMDELGIGKPMLKAHLSRLMMMDETFYKVAGMEGRAVSGRPTFKKNGIHLGATLLSNYGFSEGDAFRLSVPEAGKIVLEKVE